MRRILLAFGALFWCFAVFLISFWMTFPSQPLADRLRYEVPNRLGKEYSADVASVSPWWVGLSAQDVKIYRTPSSWRDDEEPTTQLVGIMKDVRMRVRPWSLLRRAPYVSGSVTLLEGEVDYSVGTAMNGEGGIGLADIVIGAEQLPMSDLALVVGAPGTYGGALDIAIDVHGGKEGMRDADGNVSITGANLSIADLEVPGIGPLGLEIPIASLALVAEIQGGKATIQQGRVESELVTIEIKGDVTLRDAIDRSSVDLEIVLSNLGPQLAPFEGFMGDAKGDDGNYHWFCRGVAGRLSAQSCSTHSRRTSSRIDASRTVMPRATPLPSREGETDDEREKRKEEIRERLRQKREEREAELSGRSGGVVTNPSEPVDDEPVDDEPVDEPVDPEFEDIPPEELPPEEEEGAIE